MNRRVYVVDDDTHVRQSTCFLLASLDYACRPFADGRSFLAEMSRLEPGCVLLDIFMPGASGLDVQVELMRRDIHLPVIAMSGHTDEQMARNALQLGALEILEKPFAEERLLEALQTSFARSDGEFGGTVANAKMH